MVVQAMRDVRHIERRRHMGRDLGDPPYSPQQLGALIDDVPDFPKKGILFKDITTLLKDARAFKASIDQLTELVRGFEPSAVIGMESRGFIFAAPIAYQLSAGFVPVRKLGKLPGDVISTEYDLEYGTNTLELHSDAIAPGERVLIVDDLLATGGTVSATIELVERLQGKVAAVAFLVELTELRGRDRLGDYEVISLVQF
ncbi:MAG TPA: adenine phosphoribosyltransferase [Solirubrobacteraceae bacterium]